VEVDKERTQLIRVSVKATLSRLSSGYKVYHYQSNEKRFKMSIESYWGIRLQSIRLLSKTHLDFFYNFQLLSPLAIEPLVGFRLPINLRRWKITTQMDIGSLDIKRRWSYMFNLHVSYRFSKLMSFRFG